MPSPDPPSPRAMQGTRTRRPTATGDVSATLRAIGRARPAASNQETLKRKPPRRDCGAEDRGPSPARHRPASKSPIEACATSSPVSLRPTHGKGSSLSSVPTSNPAPELTSKPRLSTLHSTGKNPLDFGNFWRFAAYQSTQPCQASPAGSSRRISRFCSAPNVRPSPVGSRSPSRDPRAVFVRPKSRTTCEQSAACGCDPRNERRRFDAA
jgi:hypothetical protein